MSYAPFGYSPYSASSQFVVGSVSQAGSSPSPCCERPAMVAESPSSATMCSLPAATAAYDSRLLTTYPRLPSSLTGTSGLYGGAGYAPDQAGYPTLAGVDSTTFYPSLNTAYGMKDGSDHWRGISQPTSYYYDPTLAAYGYGGLDLNSARRKNVTRDSTSTLKAWLNEHRKNPYPTKGEKIMLAIITKMTLTQVSTWFANARRRLKKENKMTWEPRNKGEQDGDGEEKNTASTEEDHMTSGGEDDNSSSGVHRFRGPVDQESLRCGRLISDGECTVTDRIIGRRMDTIDCRPPTENPPSGSSLGNANRGDSSIESKPFSTVVDASSLICVDPCRPLRPPVNIPCSSSVPGFTPSASSHDSSPDLSPIDPYLSAESKDSAAAAPPVGGRPELTPNNSSLPTKPKIWSLADTATSKSTSSNSFFISCSGLDSACDFASNPFANQCGWYAPTTTTTAATPSGAVTRSAVLPTHLGEDGHYSCHSSSPGSISGGVPFSGAPGVPPYSCVHGFGPVPLQTDTPPQTPPNMKVSSVAMHVGSGYLGSQHPPERYLGQSQTCAAGVQLPLPVEKLNGSYHVANLPPSSTSPYRLECLAEEGSMSSQYRTSPVQ